ncbi:MAG: phospho-sugar mutase [Acholeplasmatales bacterium]|nr:MAG: phospho-sugar mutase [Acholeplasmatales bacterium]
MTEDDITEAFYKPLGFGTGGMRGMIGAGINRMNIYTLRKAAYGFGKFLLDTDKASASRGVAIAYDNRRKSETFAKTCVEVLAALGIRSHLFEHMRPTPVLSFAVRETGASGGIMITASHNPPEYNGFKIYDETGCQLVPSLADQVIAEVEKVEDVFAIPVMTYDAAKREGFVKMLGRDMDVEYLKQIKTIPLKPEAKKTIKIVFTPLHGASREIGLRALVESGYDVIPVEEQMVADAMFSTVASPNPEDIKAFEYAIKYGHKHKADVLLATDPDGDRLGIAVRHNQEYVFLTGNQTGALFIDYVFKTRQARGDLPAQPVVYNTIVTGELGATIARSYGARVESTLTGFKYIGEKMRALENKAETFMMGYEESYGYVIRDFTRDKDSIQAMVLAAEIVNSLAAEGKTMLDRLDALYETYGAFRESLENITLKGRAGEATIRAIMEAFRTQPLTTLADRLIVAKEDYLVLKRFEGDTERPLMTPAENVLKFIFEDGGWFVLRPSGTEPKLKVYFALVSGTVSTTDEAIERVRAAVLDIVNSVIQKSNEEVTA